MSEAKIPERFDADQRVAITEVFDYCCEDFRSAYENDLVLFSKGGAILLGLRDRGWYIVRACPFCGKDLK